MEIPVLSFRQLTVNRVGLKIKIFCIHDTTAQTHGVSLNDVRCPCLFKFNQEIPVGVMSWKLT